MSFLPKGPVIQMRITRIKLSYYISAFLTLVLSPDLMAQALVMSPARQWIPQLINAANPVSFEYEKVSQLNLSLPQGKIISEYVGFTGRFKLQNLSPELSTQLFKLELVLENAEVVAKNVSIHISMNRDLGFGSATINLNVQCAAISIYLKHPQHVSAALDRSLNVVAVNATIKDDALKTELSGCTELAGLDQTIQEKVLQFVREQIINEHIHRSISEVLSKQLAKKLSKLGHSVIDEQFRLWTFLGSTTEQTFSTDETASIADNSVTSMLIKKSYVESLVKNQLNSSITKNPMLSKLDAGLQKITCSRWAQFFAWPSLMSLPKCFNLKIMSQVNEVKLLDPAAMNFSFKLNSWATAPEQKKDIAFFTTTAQVSLMQKSSRISDLTAKQYPDFITWARQSSRISKNIIKSALQKLLSEKLLSLSNDQDNQKLVNLLDVENAKFINAETLSVQLRKN